MTDFDAARLVEGRPATRARIAAHEAHGVDPCVGLDVAPDLEAGDVKARSVRPRHQVPAAGERIIGNDTNVVREPMRAREADLGARHFLDASRARHLDPVDGESPA